MVDVLINVLKEPGLEARVSFAIERSGFCRSREWNRCGKATGERGWHELYRLMEIVGKCGCGRVARMSGA